MGTLGHSACASVACRATTRDVWRHPPWLDPPAERESFRYAASVGIPTVAAGRGRGGAGCLACSHRQKVMDP